MTGLILTIAGAIMMISGIILMAPDKPKRTQDEINKEKGDAFEEFIASKIMNSGFILKDWRSDKKAKGRRAESAGNPDLEIEVATNGFSQKFAVECKYRGDYFKNGVELNSYQLSRYSRFQKERQMPVFLVIGIGGPASDPKEIFVIPLKDATAGFLKWQELRQYKREDNRRPFSYDPEQKRLQ